MSKPRYKVNLSRQLAECEANYLRLSKLMPLADESQREFAMTRAEQPWHTRIQILERSRFTTTVQMSQKRADGQAGEWLRTPKLTVRLYHDARLAEVLAWERHRRLQPRYDYPNQGMYQQDEKAQLNRFLGEWLGLCLEQGHSLEAVW